jgi:hypothetical protein
MDSFVLPHNNTYTISKYFDTILNNIEFTITFPIFMQKSDDPGHFKNKNFHNKNNNNLYPNAGGDNDDIEVFSLLG